MPQGEGTEPHRRATYVGNTPPVGRVIWKNMHKADACASEKNYARELMHELLKIKQRETLLQVNETLVWR